MDGTFAVLSLVPKLRHGKANASMKNLANFKKKWDYGYLLTRTDLAERSAICERVLQRKLDTWEAFRVEVAEEQVYTRRNRA